MRRFAMLAIVAAFCATPAPAADVPPEIDRALWCASALYWLASSAEDAGDTAEAEAYDDWSHQLLDLAGEALFATGLSPEDIDLLIAAYDERALVELGTDTAPYDVITCPSLVPGAS